MYYIYTIIYIILLLLLCFSMFFIYIYGKCDRSAVEGGTHAERTIVGSGLELPSSEPQPISNYFWPEVEKYVRDIHKPYLHHNLYDIDYIYIAYTCIII